MQEIDNPLSKAATDAPAGKIASSLGTSIRAHVAIARFDHSIKNLFVLPGIVIPLTADHSLWNSSLTWKIFLGLLATTLIACSNYVINEVLDAPFDRLHPRKRNRPAALGLVNVPLAYVQWLAMMALGVYIASRVSAPFMWTAVSLWLMGCFYNIRPFRTKDVVYLDVITESINNPIRLLLGWFMVSPTMVPPLSLLLAYWALGCYFMGLKRFSEFRHLQTRAEACAYRESFKHYSERSLLESTTFYASAAMLFFGAFAMRYRMELLLSFPCVAFLMATYFHLSFQDESSVQNPEKLYKEPVLMAGLAVTICLMCLLLLYPLPWLTRFFVPMSYPGR